MKKKKKHILERVGFLLRLSICINKLTIFILTDFSIYIDAISMGLSIVYLKGSRVEFSKYYVCLSLKIS